MKTLNMTISILFIMFTANCIGMEDLPQQKDSSKVKEASENATNFELKNSINLDSLNPIDPKEKIYTDDVAVPQLLDLFEYIRFGDLDGFKSLLIEYPELKLMRDSKMNNVLIVAAYYGDEDFVEFLLDNTKTRYEMSFSTCNTEGENAFIIACNKKNWKMAKYILDILPNNLPISGMTKCVLEDGLEIINSSNDNSSECENIKQLINAKLII